MSEKTQVTIDRVELGTGWVCFQAGKKPPEPQYLPAFLNDAFHTWLQRNPAFQVRATLPIVEHGHTVLIHVWFE